MRTLVTEAPWAFNRGVARAHGTVSAVVLAVRNKNVRRVELAWGAAIAAEWAHFVGLGVFAYKLGGTSAVGLAGFVRFGAEARDVFARELRVPVELVRAGVGVPGENNLGLLGYLQSLQS